MERLWCSYWWALFDASATVRNWIGFFFPRAADEFLSPILLASYTLRKNDDGQDKVSTLLIDFPLAARWNKYELVNYLLLIGMLGCWSWSWDVQMVTTWAFSCAGMESGIPSRCTLLLFVISISLEFYSRAYRLWRRKSSVSPTPSTSHVLPLMMINYI